MAIHTVRLPRAPEAIRPSRLTGVNWDSPLAVGLVGHYRSHGATFYDAVRGVPGTAVGGSTAYVTSVGLGSQFATSYFSFDDPLGLAGTQHATLAIWMGRTNSNHVVVAGRNSTSTDFMRFDMLWYIDGKVYWQIEDGAGSYPSSALSGTGTHLLVMAYDGTLSGTSRISAYVDGQAASLTAGGADPASTLPSSTLPMLIGTEYSSGLRYSAGYIHDTAVWRRTLTPGEIVALYDPRTRWDLYWTPSPTRYLFLGVAGGGSTVSAAMSADGVGAVSFTGASTAGAAKASSGVGAASFAGISTAAGVFASAGVAQLSATPSTTSEAAGDASGLAVASFVGASYAAGVMSSAGVGAMAMVGRDAAVAEDDVAFYPLWQSAVNGLLVSALAGDLIGKL